MFDGVFLVFLRASFLTPVDLSASAGVCSGVAFIASGAIQITWEPVFSNNKAATSVVAVIL